MRASVCMFVHVMYTEVVYTVCVSVTYTTMSVHRQDSI